MGLDEKHERGEAKGGDPREGITSRVTRSSYRALRLDAVLQTRPFVKSRLVGLPEQ